MGIDYNIEKIMNILTKVSFFKGLDLDKRTLGLFAQRAKLMKAAKNTIIFNEDQPGDSMYIIVKGKVEIFKTTPSGKKMVVDVITRSEILGEMALLDGQPRSASARALEETYMFRFFRQDFHMFLQSNFSVALKIIETLSQRLRYANEKLKCQ